jgi:hypothetical protein
MNTTNLAIAAFVTLALAACKKDEDPAPPTTPPAATTGTVRLSMDIMNGTVPFDINATYNDGAGNAIRFTTLKFYMSGTHVTNDAGATTGSFPNTYILVDAAQSGMNTFTLGNMDAGHVHELHFTLGLDEATNRADPTVAAHPLNIPGMHWSWNPNAGYKFMNMEGFVDLNGNGTYEAGTDSTFQYHCAQNVAQAAAAPVLRESDIHVHSDLVVGQTLTVEAKLDVVALLAGVDLLATPVAMGNGAGNQLLMNNLVTAITAH